MHNVFDVLKERGYIDEVTFEDELRELLGKESLTFYIGFDATADSLTLGHFIQIMVMMHMQKAGHTPIALLGGGTTMVGDPSGRTDMRKMLTKQMIDHNALKFKEQFSKFLEFSNNRAIMDNNANWLLELNLLEFMREVGVHFSVNRMLTLDCYKNRLEQGLTFFEFSYMLLQSYDYLELFRRYNCRLQMGGSDQWSNILGGCDLIRRLEGERVYAMTFKLLSTASGIKMGKTAKGAIWLDPKKTSPYEFYQYLRNTDDRDVGKFLSLLTFLPLDKVKELSSLEGADINEAKEVLAFEVTKMVHGEKEAIEAQNAAKALFEGLDKEGSIPFTEFDKDVFEIGIGILNLIKNVGLTKSNSEGRRLIEQDGLSIDNIIVKDANRIITLEDFTNDHILVKKGKKAYHQIRIK